LSERGAKIGGRWERHDKGVLALGQTQAQSHWAIRQAGEEQGSGGPCDHRRRCIRFAGQRLDRGRARQFPPAADECVSRSLVPIFGQSAAGQPSHFLDSQPLFWHFPQFQGISVTLAKTAARRKHHLGFVPPARDFG
jgi:hypothetical protein